MSDPTHQYIEDFALIYESAGFPRIAGKILGWLMICDPAEQSAADLARELEASKGSISTMLRMLLQFELIEKISIRGIRSDLYRIREGAWTELVTAKLSGTQQFVDLAERGLNVMETAPPKARKRLEEMRDLYAFFGEEMGTLVKRLEKKFKK